MMAFTWANSGSVLPNGTAITTGNSGGAAGQPWDVIQLGTASTVKSDTSTSDPPYPACTLMATPSTPADNVFVDWRTFPGGGTGGAGQAFLSARMSLYMTYYPPSDLDLMYALDTGSNFCSKLFLGGPNGRIGATDSSDTDQAVTTTKIPLYTWVRAEFDLTGNAGAGAVTVRLFTNSRATTATETVTATGINTQGPVCFWRFGPAVATAKAAVTVRYANFGLSTSGPMGPDGGGRNAVMAAFP